MLPYQILSKTHSVSLHLFIRGQAAGGRQWGDTSQSRWDARAPEIKLQPHRTHCVCIGNTKLSMPAEKQ
jgi:hypothetical protein